MLGGVALGGAAGLDMVVTGKLDPMTPSMMFEAQEPRDWYDRADAIPFAEPYRPYQPTAYTPVSQTFDDMALIEYAESELAGGPDVQPGGGMRGAENEPIPTEAELRREIERLYQASLAADQSADFSASSNDEAVLTDRRCSQEQGALEEAGAAGCADAEPTDRFESYCANETDCARAPVDARTHAAAAAAPAARVDRRGDRGLWAG